MSPLTDNRPQKVLNKSAVSWASYDFANTIFSMNVVSLYFALWVVNDLGGTDLMVALARSAAMLLIAITMPLLGSISDIIGRRKWFIFLFTLMCGLATALLGSAFSLTVYLVLFGVAVYGFQAALVFYNALLPDVSPKNKEGKVSGLGVAFGYIGSIAGMLMVRPFVGSEGSFSRQNAFIPTALLFLVFSLPLFIFTKERRKPPVHELPRIKELFITPYRVFKQSSTLPDVRRFLIARFFIVEAMETIIAFMAVYLVMVGGFNQKRVIAAGMDEVMLFLVSATVFAVIGSFIWGVMADKLGPGRSLKICSFLWVITLALATFNFYQPLFWVVGPLAGIGLGGVWTTDRHYLLKVVPKERRAEFFGLYAVSGRLAAVIGPIVWGLAVAAGKPYGDIKYRIAVGAVFIMMLIGFLLVRKLPEV